MPNSEEEESETRQAVGIEKAVSIKASLPRVSVCACENNVNGSFGRNLGCLQKTSFPFIQITGEWISCKGRFPLKIEASHFILLFTKVSYRCCFVMICQLPK